MNVYFCDLCNESIPQADLDLGRAVRRNDRLICAACEAAMSAGPAHPEPAPVAVAEPERIVPPPAPAPAHSSTVAVVALTFSSVALVAGIGAIAYLFWRLEEQSARLQQQIVDLEKLAPEHARSVSAKLSEETSERESEAAQTRGAYQALTARVQELEQSSGEVSALERRIDKVDEHLGALDDLASRVQHQTNTVDDLAVKVKVLETMRARDAEGAPSDTPAVAQAPAGAPAPLAVQASSAAWQKWLPDLKSPVPGTRWQAVQALGETHDVAAIEPLVPMLDDEGIFVRMASCRSLSNLGGLQAVPALIDTLEDEEGAVRDAAYVALKGLTDALTNETLPFDPLAREGDRSKRVKAWRDWWQEASKDLLAKGKTRSKS